MNLDQVVRRSASLVRGARLSPGVGLVAAAMVLAGCAGGGSSSATSSDSSGAAAGGASAAAGESASRAGAEPEVLQASRIFYVGLWELRSIEVSLPMESRLVGSWTLDREGDLERTREKLGLAEGEDAEAVSRVTEFLEGVELDLTLSADGSASVLWVTDEPAEGMESGLWSWSEQLGIARVETEAGVLTAAPLATGGLSVMAPGVPVEMVLQPQDESVLSALASGHLAEAEGSIEFVAAATDLFTIRLRGGGREQRVSGTWMATKDGVEMVAVGDLASLDGYLGVPREDPSLGILLEVRLAEGVRLVFARP